MTIIKKELKEKYDSLYSDKTEEWRRIGAMGKVRNILDLTKGLRFDTVVDIGAGDGNVLSLLAEKRFCSKLTAVEISSSAIEQIKRKSIDGLMEIIEFDGYNFPVEDKVFDLATCSHVIEHVEFPRKQLREIKRISKMQVFEVPIDFSFSVDKKFKHFNAYGHINIYTPALFNFLLYTEGYEILKFKNSLYGKEVIKYQNKKMSLKYILVLIKRLIMKSIPFLMKIKPDTYTVLTR
jgi:ubiquinone/menaquinone biosynthesis C-methylase UbiE